MPPVVIASLSPRKHGLGLMSVYVRFLVHKVALGQACHWVLRFPPVCIIPPMCHFGVKQSHNRPGVSQRVPGGLASQISMTFGTWRWWGCQPHAPAAFSPRKCSWYSFSLGAESTPGPWYGRKEYVTEKSSDTTGNRSRDRPTSSAAP